MLGSIRKAALAVVAITVGVRAAPMDTAADFFNLPLEWTSFGFVTSAISVGTPPQPVKSFVDWTWIGQYLFTPLCHGSMTDTLSCLPKGQSIFNQTKSTTFRNQSSIYPEREWKPNHFFDYDPLNVQYGSDIERIGSKSSTRITVMAGDMLFHLSEAYPFTGVFGMSPAFSSDNASTESAFSQIYKAGAYRSPRVAFAYCYNSTFGNDAPARSLCNGNDAIQMLGGYDESLIKDNITWYSVIKDPEINVLDFVYSPAVLQYWATGLTKHMIGDEEQALNRTAGNAAVFDHASYGRGAPVSVNSYTRLLNVTRAKPIKLDEEALPNNGNQSFASVDCDRVSSFPSLKYQFDGAETMWEIIPQNYVEKVNTTSGQACVLNVRTLGNGDFVMGNFGETFAKDKVILFDFEALKVGVADLKF